MEENARHLYQNSDQEEQDIIREFNRGNGSVTHLMNNIPFMRIEDVNRVIELIQQLMSLNKVPMIPIKKLARK